MPGGSNAVARAGTRGQLQPRGQWIGARASAPRYTLGVFLRSRRAAAHSGISALGSFAALVSRLAGHTVLLLLPAIAPADSNYWVSPLRAGRRNRARRLGDGAPQFRKRPRADRRTISESRKVAGDAGR